MTGWQYPYAPDHPHYRLIRELIEQADQESEIARVAGTEKVVDFFCRTEKIDKESVSAVAIERGMGELQHFPDFVKERLRDLTDEQQFEFLSHLAGNWAHGFQFGYTFAVNRPDAP